MGTWALLIVIGFTEYLPSCSKGWLGWGGIILSCQAPGMREIATVIRGIWR
jgi:hypothetical protein